MTEILPLLESLIATIRAAPLLASASLGAAFIAAALSPSQRALAHWAIAPAIALSPLTFATPAPEAWLMLAASVLLFGAIAEFARDRERYQHVAPAGLRLMIGASMTPAIWGAVPAIAALSPALSPWRQNYNQFAGFLFVLWSPLMMFAAAALYLFWMFDFSVYRLPPISLTQLQFQAALSFGFANLAPALTVIALTTLLKPETRGAGFVGILALIGGIASLSVIGAPTAAHIALASGAAFAFAAASMRPGLMMILAILASAAVFHLAS